MGVDTRNENAKQRHEKAEQMWLRADKLEDSGRVREAFRLFQSAANLGHVCSQNCLGLCFDIGRGVRRSRAKAMYWYRKALRGGDDCAPTNIGTIYRDDGRPRLALRWFKKAVAMGNYDALLDIGKLYLGPLDDTARARAALVRVSRIRNITEDTREQAIALIGTIYRDDGRPRLALRRFEKAVAMGRYDALLEIGKLYLGPLDDTARARAALVRVSRIKIGFITEETRDQAVALLKKLGASRARRSSMRRSRRKGTGR